MISTPYSSAVLKSPPENLMTFFKSSINVSVKKVMSPMRETVKIHHIESLPQIINILIIYLLVFIVLSIVNDQNKTTNNLLKQFWMLWPKKRKKQNSKFKETSSERIHAVFFEDQFEEMNMNLEK